VAAYVDMELDEQTDNMSTESLHQARQRAYAHINSDSKWVFKNLPSECPRHYKPASTTPHTSHITQPKVSLSTNANAEPSSSPHTSHVAQPEVSSSTNANAEPSLSISIAVGTSLPNNANIGPSTKTPMHPDATKQSDVHLSYRDDKDDDT
jgi:hypothetical protein